MLERFKNDRIIVKNEKINKNPDLSPKKSKDTDISSLSLLNI